MRNLLLVAVLIVSGCASTPVPTGLEAATPERVDLIYNTLGERLSATPMDNREMVAILSCGLAGAGVYFFQNMGEATKEERILAGINAANRHGRQFYSDVLGEATYIEFVTEKFGLDEGASEGERWLGVLRYFLYNWPDLQKLLTQLSPSASSSATSSYDE